MRSRLLVAAALLACLGSGADAAVFMNGGFEIGPDPGVFTEHGTGDSTITGWTVTSGTIDYIGTYWQAQGGSSRSIDLAGSSLGTIEQTFDTIAGQTYQVNFYTSRNPDGGDPLRSGTVSINGTDHTFYYSASNDRSNMMWLLNSYTFTASGTSSTLSFAADASAGCCYGPALDSVSVAAVPEPSTWAMMLMGFGAIGVGLRRRRRPIAQLA